MSAGQRNKGSAGERELFHLLTEELGISVKRNLSQTRGGGADSIDIPGWAVECKRQEKFNLNTWWEQTLNQRNGRKPVLFYRANRMPWMAMFRLCDVNMDLRHSNTVTMGLEAGCLVIRESIATAALTVREDSV